MRLTGLNPLSMTNRTFCRIGAVIIVTLLSVPVNAWLLDRGLESTINRMKNLFQQRKLTQLYDEHVDGEFKRDINRLIDRMKKDTKNGNRIARRIGFAHYGDLKKADADTIVAHFFETMLHPPRKKPPAIENESYLRLALALSLLFSYLDEGMEIADKRIDRKNAEVIYKGKGFMMAVCYVYRDNRWYQSDDRHCRKK